MADDEILGGEDFSLDLGRQARCGVPEIVYGLHKTIRQVEDIVACLLERRGHVFVTGLDEQGVTRLAEKYSQGCGVPEAGTFRVGSGAAGEVRGRVGVVSAGTSDFRVLREVEESLIYLGAAYECYFDMGVAGLPRLLGIREKLMTMNVLIVAAGMDGALPGVVAGLCQAPVIGLPTSVGYGIGANGVSALMTMLNSCSPGVSVVNIDNGVGAAVTAVKMCRVREDL